MATKIGGQRSKVKTVEGLLFFSCHPAWSHLQRKNPSHRRLNWYGLTIIHYQLTDQGRSTKQVQSSNCSPALAEDHIVEQTHRFLKKRSKGKVKVYFLRMRSMK